MGLSLRPTHLSRYRDIAMLLVNHGRDVLDDTTSRADADKLADDLESMGPTFVKLGQLLSTRADLLPPTYLDALSRLQDDVEPLSFAVIEPIVEAELGVRISKAFESFDSSPLASASIGQVHRAVLRDGRDVVVKVQRPDIRDRIRGDMEAIEEIASFADAHTDAGRRFAFTPMVDEFRRSLLAELDYRSEAANLVTLGEIVERYDRIVVPQPIDDYCTDRVLTIEYVDGRKVTDLGPLAHLELDGDALAGELFRAYLDQVLVHGFFHADPHPGNVLVADDSDDGRLALIDLGMVGRVEPGLRDDLLKMLLALADGDGREVAEICIEIGQKLDDFDRAALIARIVDLVARSGGASVGDLQAGAVIGELSRVSGECGLRAPSELTMLAKALLNLDEVARTLAPDFRPEEAIRLHTAELLRQRMLSSLRPSSVLSAAMDAREFAEKLPGRVNKVFDALADGRLTLNVQGIDERELMRGIQKIANRVTMGLVLAALIVGAAMTMRVTGVAELWGYPALSVVLFLLAVLGGLALVVSIFVSDLPQRHRRHRRR